MNRFSIVRGREAELESHWRSRESRLDQMPGFLEFHLLRGPEFETHTLYVSYTLWSSHESFLAWTQSEAFAFAHRDASGVRSLHVDHPQFEGFVAVQTLGDRQGRGRDAA